MGLQAALSASEIVQSADARARHRADRDLERGELPRRDPDLARRPCAAPRDPQAVAGAGLPRPAARRRHRARLRVARHGRGGAVTTDRRLGAERLAAVFAGDGAHVFLRESGETWTVDRLLALAGDVAQGRACRRRTARGRAEPLHGIRGRIARRPLDHRPLAAADRPGAGGRAVRPAARRRPHPRAWRPPAWSTRGATSAWPSRAARRSGRAFPPPPSPRWRSSRPDRPASRRSSTRRPSSSASSTGWRRRGSGWTAR